MARPRDPRKAVRQSSRQRIGVALVALVCALALGPEVRGALQRGPVPQLLVEGPEAVRAAVEGVRSIEPARLAAVMRLVGLEDPGPPIHVLVVPEDSPVARDAPAWIAGFADGDDDLVVLFPERSLSYPHASFEELVGHEVAHVLIHRAAGGRPVPRWLHEGMATVAGGSWGLDDRMRMTWAVLIGGAGSLAALEEDFASGEPARIARAYALSGAFVRDVLARSSGAAPARILRAVAAGSPFEEAFATGAGMSLDRAEALFWQRSERWYRWVPLATSSLMLWSFIVVLALWAHRRRRARAVAIRARWDEERSPDEEPDRS